MAIDSQADMMGKHDGEFATAALKNYPEAMCKALARVLEEWLWDTVKQNSAAQRGEKNVRSDLQVLICDTSLSTRNASKKIKNSKIHQKSINLHFPLTWLVVDPKIQCIAS